MAPVLLHSFSAGRKILFPAEILEGLSAKIREIFAWGSTEFKPSPPIKHITARPDPLLLLHLSFLFEAHLRRLLAFFHPFALSFPYVLSAQNREK
jgi:hypothetical protein